MSTEIIFGPPGTGKTTEGVRIVEEEIARGTPPEKIAYFSFTRRAAGEASSRAVEKFGLVVDRFPWFRTLHSMCYRRLGLRSGDVLEGAALREFASRVGVRITGRWSDDGTYEGFELGDRVLHMDNLARVRGRSLREEYDEDCDDLPWSEVQRVSRALREFKEDEGLVDYTDMLAMFASRGAPPEVDVLVLDEAQDQSKLQWTVADRVGARCRRVVVAGDDDQAIYRWAGADSDHMLGIVGDARVLDRSWRVPREIQVLAEKIIGPIRRRKAKRWRPRDGRGIVDRASRFHYADASGEDVLVLARNTYVLREQVEPALRSAGVVYEWRGRSSIDPRVLTAVRAWERLRRGDDVTVQEARQVYGFMSSGVGVRRGSKELRSFPDDAIVTMRDLRERGGLMRDDIWHEALDRLPAVETGYLLAALRRGERPTTSRPRVRLSTIHGEKGGQARHVILLRDMARRTHREMERAPDDERRVWYVAATRAQERLTIVDSDSPQACPWL